MASLYVQTVTDTTCIVAVYDLSTVYTRKRLTYFYSKNPDGAIVRAGQRTVDDYTGGDISLSYGGLESETEYTLIVNIEQYVPGSSYQMEASLSRVITTTGSGGADPYYIAVGDDTRGAIDINIYDYAGIEYSSFTYYIRKSDYSWSDSYSTAYASHTFSGLSSGDYVVYVDYIYGGTAYTIYDSNGASSTDITITTGVKVWTLSSRDLGSVATTTSRTLSSLGENTLYCWAVFFPSAGTVTFSSSGSADTRAWLSGYNQTSWNDTTGVPDAYLAYDDDSGSGSNFEITYTCDANTYYHLWFRTYSGGSYSGNVTITFTPSGSSQSWAYDSVAGFDNLSYETTKDITLSQWRGRYFAVSFARSGTAVISVPSGSNVDLFVTVGDNGYDVSDGSPYTSTGSKVTSSKTHTLSVSTNRYYYVWVKGATSSVTGTVFVTITPPESAPAEWRSSDRPSIINPSGTATDMISMTAGYVYKTLIQFASSGEASFYSETTSGPGKIVGYLTETDSGIDPSTGVPYGTIVASDDSGDGEFEFNYNVHAGRSYYLWVRATSITAYGVITEIIKMISAVSDRGFWIWADTGDGYKWHYLTSYLYTDRWRQVKAYTATSTGWIDEY